MAEWHRITNGDLEFMVGDCSVCGPGVPVGQRRARAFRCEYRKWRDRRGYEPVRVSASELRATLLAADGKCPLCQKSKTLRRDHDHETGRFRGWLCIRCNSALGTLGDSPEGLLRALAYLEGGL